MNDDQKYQSALQITVEILDLLLCSQTSGTVILIIQFSWYYDGRIHDEFYMFTRERRLTR